MILLFLSLGSYIFLGLLLRGNIQPFPQTKKDWLPNVSVVVAAKNEEQYLHDCLTSILQLNYPDDKLEIIIVDDASSDATSDIIESFARDSKLIHIKLANRDKIKLGKAGALLAGIEKSSGEFIFITDADCVVPKTWIRTMLSGFGERTGIVGGFTLLHPPKTVLQKLQALDWHYLLSIASAASHLNKPITWVGNNLAVRRTAYDQVGGYENLDESFVEDFALIDAIERQTPWKCRFYASPKSIIRTHAIDNLSELYAQRKRWGMGISAARPFGVWIMVTSFLTHLLSVIFLFLSLPMAILSIILKMCVDYLIFVQSRQTLRESFQFIDFLFYQFYYIAYSIILPLLILIDRQISWKGTELRRD